MSKKIADCIERLQKSRQMVANMASEARCPKMQIPAQDTEENEDVYICKTIEMAIALFIAAQYDEFMTSCQKQSATWEDAGEQS